MEIKKIKNEYLVTNCKFNNYDLYCTRCKWYSDCDLKYFKPNRPRGYIWVVIGLISLAWLYVFLKGLGVI